MQPYPQQPPWGMNQGHRPRFGSDPPRPHSPGPRYGGPSPCGQHRGPPPQGYHGGPPQHRGPSPQGHHGGPPQHRGPPPQGHHRSPAQGNHHGPVGAFRGPAPGPRGLPDGGHPRFNSNRHMRPPLGPPNSVRPPGMGPPPPRHGFEPFMRPQGRGQGPKYFHNSKPGGGGAKKAKVDKRDLPENNRFYCDTCDRGYKDEDKYQAHIGTHEKCPEEGCTYIAAGKLVQMHINLQHRSGLAKKIWALESPEEIQKWREERRKNFPTTENISKKKAVIADKIARGEVIEEKYFGKMRGGGKSGRGRGRGRGRDRFSENRDSAQRDRGNVDQVGNQQTVKDCGSSQKRKLSQEEASGDTEPKQQRVEGDTDKETADALAMFFGAGSSDSDSDTDDDDTQESTTKVTPAKAAGALGNLITSYEDNESEDEVTEVVKTEKTKRDQQLREGGNKQRQRNRAKGKKTKDKWQAAPKLDKSLLEKLLAKEIRQERNKILQCVHYIVKSDFFDVKSESSGS